MLAMTDQPSQSSQQSSRPKQAVAKPSLNRRRQPPTYIYTAAQLMAKGKTYAQVANELGRRPTTIREWEVKYPDIFRESAIESASPQDLMKRMLPKALRVLEETLDIDAADAATHGIRHSAAEKVLDRLWGTPRQTLQVDSRSHILVEFREPSAQPSIEGEIVEPAAMIGPGTPGESGD